METHILVDSDNKARIDKKRHVKRCKILIAFAFILIVIITVAILIVTLRTDSSIKTCSCNTRNSIELNSYSCVIPISDGLGTTNIAGGLFPDWTINDYINITDINNNNWIIYNNNTQQYEWKHPNEWFSYLLLTQNDTTNKLIKILIDASVGVVRPSVSLISSPQIYDELISLGCDDIDIVISTHFHQDHTGWFVKWNNNTNNQTNNIIPTFPNAKYYSSRIEYDYWNGRPSSNKSWLRFDERIVPIFESDQLVLVDAGNYNITKYISVRNCSGHTPGHQCIIFDDYDDIEYNQQYIFFGDLMNRVVQISKPELNGWPDVDINGAIERRIEMLNYMYTNDVIAFPAHFGKDINPGKVVYCDYCNADNNFTWMGLFNE
eukprot:255464_1